MAEGIGTVIGQGIVNNQKLSRAVVTKTQVFNYIGLSSAELLSEALTEIWETQDLGNHFTLDHPVNGVLDSATLELDTGLGDLITSRLLNVNNTFKEKFRDTELIDTVTSTNTVNTSTSFNATFTIGEIMQSKVIAKDNTSFIKATLIVDDDTNLTLQLSADGGSNWETVTNNTEHIFTNNSVAGVKYKLTATGNATITSIKIKYD